MTVPLLTTKFYVPPPQPNLVSRPRLMQRLERGLRQGHQLTLVSAPAGFGKTTLLSAWVAERRERVAWLSLDADDNEPPRFWTYLIAALQMVQDGAGTDAAPALGQEALQLLQVPNPPAIETILTRLLNEIAALPGEILLVLDDYHVISTPAIQDGLAFLLTHHPPPLHMVISTRADPPLPIVRLRARGQLTELRADDLRFTPPETASFLNELMGLDLLPEDVAALEARTEGWVVGLRLAGLSMQGRTDPRAFIRAFTGSHHYILEYLTQEVLNRQPEATRRFLAETAILKRLCGPLCDAVTGGQDGAATLARLHRDNLFTVPLDEAHHWYRYHHLFADLLGNLLRERASREEIAALHRRASRWYEGEGLAAEAVRHALAAGEAERAAGLVEQNAIPLFNQGKLAAALALVRKLPGDLARRRPMLNAYHAFMLAVWGQLEAIEGLLADAEAYLSPDHPYAPFLRAFITAIRAQLANFEDDLPRALALAQQARERAPEGDLAVPCYLGYLLGDVYFKLGDLVQAEENWSEAVRVGQKSGNIFYFAPSMADLAYMKKVQGRLGEAEALYAEVRRWATELDALRSRVMCPLEVGLGELLRERNALEAAERHTRAGIEHSRRHVTTTSLLLGIVTLMRLLEAQGRVDEALECLPEAEDTVRTYRVLKGAAAELDAWKVRRWLTTGDLDAATRWARQRQADLTDAPALVRERVSITLARVLLAQGWAEPNGPHLDQASRRLGRLAQQAEAGGRGERWLQIRVLQALVLAAQRQPDPALTTLAEALARAAPEGYVRIFADEGRPLADLLRLGVRREAWYGPRLKAYVKQLLTAFEADAEARGEKVAAAPAPSPLIEPLSEREREVLALICKGHSNQAIAERLVITVNTVKKHSSNIYGKLEVSSRAQAIARAHELGLC